MPDNFDKYKGRLQALHREAKTHCWTTPLATMIYLLTAVLIATIILRIIYSFAGGLTTVIIFVAETAALLATILYYDKNVREYMEVQCAELTETNPGLDDAYEEWKERTKKAMPDGSSNF